MPPSSTTYDPGGLAASVKAAIATHKMLTPGDRVLVGVSGGPDSMALLHLLDRMHRRLAVDIGVAHLNHGLRGATAERDADAVGRTAAAMGYPFHTIRADVKKVKRHLGLSLEAAARRVRYAFFNKVMTDSAYNKLALGHHMEDNAEQMLMALLRGAGTRGLSGIRPVRDSRIVRPLINARRAQIDAYVKANHIVCMLDESNNDLRFVRNRIRHRLLPILASEYNPRITEQLNRLADLIRTEEEWIEGVVSGAYERVCLYHGATSLALSVTKLIQTHPAERRRMIRMALKDVSGSLQRISFSHVQSVLDLLMDGSAERESHLPGGILVRRSGNQLILMLTTNRGRGKRDSGAGWAHSPVETVIDAPFPRTVEIDRLGIGLRFSVCDRRRLPQWSEIGPKQAYLDLDRLAPPLIVRRPRPGDRFRPLGAGGSQKLKKFFIDHHVPRKERARVPVLSDGRRIVWIVGQRIDDAVKVTSASSRILGVEFFLLDTR